MSIISSHGKAMRSISTTMLQDNKDVKDANDQAADGEEVDQDHAAWVIAEESLLFLGKSLAESWDHAFGDGALGICQAELQQFTLDGGGKVCPGATNYRSGHTFIASASKWWCLLDKARTFFEENPQP